VITDRYNITRRKTMFEMIPWRRHQELDPFRRAMDDLFAGFFEGRPLRLVGDSETWIPSMDVSETDTAFVVKAELPGMDPKEMDVSFEKGVLTVRGERKREEEENTENFHRVERRYGSFCRAFHLPGEVDTENMEAEYREGVLKIRLPKSKEHSVSKIEVKAA
jgi:HSP20 family protein